MAADELYGVTAFIRNVDGVKKKPLTLLWARPARIILRSDTYPDVFCNGFGRGHLFGRLYDSVRRSVCAPQLRLPDRRLLQNESLPAHSDQPTDRCDLRLKCHLLNSEQLSGRLHRSAEKCAF